MFECLTSMGQGLALEGEGLGLGSVGLWVGENREYRVGEALGCEESGV
jgi:hypothetical protein